MNDATLTIDVAESTSFALLRVVKATSPIYSNIALAAVEPGGALHTATGANTAKLKETIEYRTVITDVVLALLLRICVHIVRCYF